MLRISTIFLIYFFSSFSGYAQIFSTIDSLRSQLISHRETNKVDIHIALAEEYYRVNPDSSVTYLKKVLANEKIQSLRKDSLFYWQRKYLRLLNFVGNYSVVIPYIDSLSSSQKLDSLQLTQLSVIKAVSLGSLAQYNQALLELTNSATFYKKKDLKKELSNVYYEIGELFREQKAYKEALRYFNSSFNALKETVASQPELGRIKNSSSIILFENGEPDSAIHLLKDVLNQTNPDKEQYIISILFQNLGLAYMHAGKNDSSLYYLFKAKEIKEAQNNKSGLLYTYNSIADIYIKEQRFNHALKFLYKNMELFRHTQDLHLERNTYGYLATVYGQLNKFDSAYFFLRKKESLQDSITSASKLQERLRTLGAYETQLKEQENRLLIAELDLKDQEVKTEHERAGFILMIAIIALIALMVIYYFLRQKNSLFKKISEKNFKLRELNNEVNNLSGIIAHDLKAPLNKVEGLTNILSLEGGLNASQTDIIDRIKLVTKDGKSLIGDLIDISNYEQGEESVPLKPVKVYPILDDIIKGFKFRLEKKAIEIELLVPQYLQVYTNDLYFKRIMDNLISNAIKFSPKRKKVEIGYIAQDEYQVLFVKDDGPGLSKTDKLQLFQKFKKLSAQPTDGENSTGLGLSIVQALCNKLRAPIEVESELGFGTCFKVKFPVHKDSE